MTSNRVNFSSSGGGSSGMAAKSAPVDSSVSDEMPMLMGEESAPPMSKPELNDVLRQLYRCVRNKKRVDGLPEEPLRLNRTSPETLDTFKLMDRFILDAESMLSFSCSLVIKEFIFDVVVDLVKSSRSDEFTKMAFTIFKKLLDYEFNQDEDKFVYEEQVKSLYSPVFVRLIPHLNDIAVEESFYGDDEDDVSAFQSDMLALLFYLFKTISLRKLIRLGLKPRHLQFIIIHFTNSLYIPRLMQSIAANLDAKTVLDDELDETEMIDERVHSEEKLFVINIYSITVRSCLLLHRYHSGNRETSSLIRQAFWHSANFAAKSPTGTESEATFQKMARKVVGYFRKKMAHHANTPYMQADPRILCDYMKMIEFYIGIMAPAHRSGLVQKLVSHVKKILEKAIQCFQKTKIPAELTDCCFSLLNRIIQISREEFIAGHLKNIEATWTQFLMKDTKMAFVAFITLLEVKVCKAPFMMFVRRFLNAAADRINVPECHVLLFFRPLLMLYEHYTNDPLVCEERRVKSLIDQFRAILRKRSAMNANYLNAYLELAENLLRIHSADCPWALVHEIMYTLETLLLKSYDFELNPQATSRSLNIISLVLTSCANSSDMAQHGNMLYQLLSLIQLSRRDDDWDFNCHIESLKEQLAVLSWIPSLLE